MISAESYAHNNSQSRSNTKIFKMRLSLIKISTPEGIRRYTFPNYAINSSAYT